ncbi:dihydrofolate reductase [Tribolium castaneum]|uniref:dihydrofolate reductase n=1 Tax=Tribolium castaneum TaxID=7070 RepID=D6WRE9_TRICA|nr:PREDICTED: dihydrofolate reductase [Tribolium castaneum]EFA07671.2 Dihydrofolate reductase-like Protein [Tribolium castaneum]|eukprot:XP_008195168.1 PREDICTED: dihydrofolate reductase [Tribolium castaneum]
MVIKFDLIAAACENMGIGKNNDLPWRLKSELAFFSQMTTQTSDESKKNVVLMGRKTWDSIPPKFKPLHQRFNFIMSRAGVNLEGYKDCFSFKSLDEVISKLQDEKFQQLYENVWVIGGSYIYEATMASKYFHRLYLTKVLKTFDCDTFFPKIRDDLIEVRDPRVPEGVQEENGIQFVYHVYQNPDFNKL